MFLCATMKTRNIEEKAIGIWGDMDDEIKEYFDCC